jgi:hypothetical protein
MLKVFVPYQKTTKARSSINHNQKTPTYAAIPWLDDKYGSTQQLASTLYLQ